MVLALEKLTAGAEAGSSTFRLATHVGLIACTLFATTDGTPIAPQSEWNYLIGTGWHSQDLRSIAGHFVVTTPVTGQSESEGNLQSSGSTADLVKQLHERSGLTWDQIGKLMGVSRRSVHFWASGGRLSAANQEALARVLSAVENLPATDPSGRRANLLAPDTTGQSIYDRLRSVHASSSSDINRPWEPPATGSGEA